MHSIKRKFIVLFCILWFCEKNFMWAIAGLLSAFFPGIYDILKKTSLNGNAVIPVLFFLQ
jgi:hypothetical protein